MKKNLLITALIICTITSICVISIMGCLNEGKNGKPIIPFEASECDVLIIDRLTGEEYFTQYNECLVFYGRIKFVNYYTAKYDENHLIYKQTFHDNTITISGGWISKELQ